jgi:redox-sensitive bicupin YhaK (pirin superfamily)
MMDPRYRDVQSEQIPEIRPGRGIGIKVISGEIDGTRGPVGDIAVDTEYLDVTLEPHTVFEHPVEAGNRAFAYVFRGAGYFEQYRELLVHKGHLVLYEDGDSVTLSTADDPLRCILVSGKPLNEPVAWHGPVVMNTQGELELAFEEYANGTFIKHH